MATPKIFTNAWVQNIKKVCENQRVLLTSLVPLNLHEAAPGKRRAAVLVPLCNRNNIASVLFTVRTQHVSTHKGQVSFPGGHMDDGETAIEAALRETQEELGHGIGKIHILGTAQTVIAMTGTLVTPVIAFVEQDLQEFAHLTPSTEEVSKVFTRSISELTDPAQKGFETWNRFGKEHKVPVFGPNNEDRIWGLTAIILQGVLDNAILPQRP